jgi:hypothetical protein
MVMIYQEVMVDLILEFQLGMELEVVALVGTVEVVVLAEDLQLAVVLAVLQRQVQVTIPLVL